MFTRTHFERGRIAAEDELQSVMQVIGDVQCPRISRLSVNLAELSPRGINELLDLVPTGKSKNQDVERDYIYVFQIDSPRTGLQHSLASQIERARKAKNGYCYCQVNDQHITTHTLYVGRSKKLRTRLRQHLGDKSPRIYAMHLQRWATGNNARVSISYMMFEDRDDLLVQAVEDGLWTYLRPLFGRKGAR